MDAVARTGTPEDSDHILEVMSRAFKHDESSPRYLTLKALASHNADRYQVLALDGRVIAVAHIGLDRLRVGRAHVVKGDVGHVSVHPDLQGQGYGSALMRHCVNWMAENGCDISRLGGFAGFYAKFGWEPFPRRYVEFRIQDVKAGPRVLSPDKLFALPGDYPGVLRPYDDHVDRLERWQVYERFNANRSGALVQDRPAEPSGKPGKPAEDNPLRVVYERDGRMRGYAFALWRDEENSAFEAQVTIGDMAYDTDEPMALNLLLRHILLEAHARGATRITARIPFDAGIVADLRRAEINADFRELHASVASNMIRVVNLSSTLARTRTAFVARLGGGSLGDWRGALTFVVGEEQVTWRIDRADIESVGGPGDGVRVELGHAEFVALLLGVRSFGETLASHERRLGPVERGVLSVLFPRQPAASGPWG